jgi:uncharacterized protein (UPF0254 family)
MCFNIVKEIPKPTTKPASSLTSLAGLPSLTGGRSLLPLPQPKEPEAKGSLKENKEAVKKPKEEEMKKETETSKYLKKAPEKPVPDSLETNANPQTVSQAPPLTNPSLKASSLATKPTGIGKELIDDVSEEILDEIDAAADEEDEEFARMLAKAKEIKRNSSVGVSGVAVAPFANLNVPVIGTKEQQEKKQDLLPLNVQSKPVDSKDKVEIPKLASVVAAQKTAKQVPLGSSKKIEHDYEEDFEVGHTDEEIVFSDDGLSLSGSKSDDAF